MRRSTGAIHSTEPGMAHIAATIGDPARAAMLFALVDGRELPASELALRADVSAQACTAHLKKLVDAGLLAVRAAGRQRLFRMTSVHVAHAMEALALIARPARVVALSQSTAMARLREARSCYDHLAGRLGVAVTDGLVACGALHNAEGDFDVPVQGEGVFASLGVDVASARSGRRRFARACLDWTERRPHLAGALGACVLRNFVRYEWVVRSRNDRALRITARGRLELERRLGIHCE